MDEEKKQEQHFVSKTYLKRFTRPFNQTKYSFFCANIVNDFFHKPYRTSPKKECTITDFYNITDEMFLNEDEEFNTLEKIGMIRFENDYSKIIEEIEKFNIKLSFNNASTLLQGGIMMKIRNPFFRDAVNAKSDYEQNVNETINELTWLVNSIKDEMKETWEQNNFTIEKKYKAIENIKESLLKNYQIKNLQNATLLRREKLTREKNSGIVVDITNKYLRRKWTILESSDDTKFITSDNLGFCCDNEGNFENVRFDGNMNFYFPLTTKFTLKVESLVDNFYNGNTKYIHHKKIDNNSVKGINIITAILCNKKVFGESEKSISDVLSNIKL